MDERTIYAFGGLFVASIALLSTLYGKGAGGRAWAIAWSSLVASGASRTFVAASPILVPAYTLLGSMFSLLLLLGSWRFSRGAAPVPRRVAVALLLAVPLRMVLHPFLPGLANRALGTVLCTVCVALSCFVLLRPLQGSPSPSARSLAFLFPLIALVSWIDGMGPALGLSQVRGTSLWFALGVAVASVKISAFLTRRVEREALLREELAAHMRDVTEASTDLVIEVGDDGTILYANPAHETLLGIAPRDLIGGPVEAVLAGPVAGVVRAQDVEPEALTFIAYHRQDAHAVTLESTSYRVRHASGHDRMVVVSRDISVRAARERSREALNAELEALVESRTEELRSSLVQLQEASRLASLGTMAAGVAHQINNPVGSIQMSAEYALSAPQDAPDRDATFRRALENSVAQAKRCGRIVTSMLQFARNEPTTKGPEDLAAIVRRACDATEPYARERNATLTTKGLDAPLPVLASPIELEQAFLNLVRNGCEASDEAVQVSVEARREPERALVTVRDNGCGIPQEAIDQVLDPFFTTRLDAGGTGLGLSVAHGVIVDHGGSLGIESKPGEGTCVTVSLPVESGRAVDS